MRTTHLHRPRYRRCSLVTQNIAVPARHGASQAIRHSRKAAAEQLSDHLAGFRRGATHSTHCAKTVACGATLHSRLLVPSVAHCGYARARVASL